MPFDTNVQTEWDSDVSTPTQGTTVPRNRSLEETSANSITRETRRLMAEFETRCLKFQKLQDEGKVRPIYQEKPTNLDALAAESPEERRERYLHMQFQERLKAAAGMYGDLVDEKHVVAKDLTERAGYFARTATVIVTSGVNVAYRDITIVASTEDDLRKLPRPTDPAAERLCVYDRRLNESYDYRDYPHRAGDKSITIEGTDLVEAGTIGDSLLVAVSQSDFRDAMQTFPYNVEMDEHPSIPRDLTDRFLQRINENVNPPPMHARDNDRHPPQR